MVGAKAETGGIAKDGAKMVTAVACANVPQVQALVTRRDGTRWGALDRVLSPAPRPA